VRFLFTTTSGLGHFHPLVPLARDLVGAGHDVAFACPESLHARVKATGFDAYIVVPSMNPDPERIALMSRFTTLPPGREANLVMLADGFVGISARRTLPNLVELCGAWRPDVIVREDYEFAGAIAADHLGLPHATVQVGYAFDWRHLQGTPVQERLDQLRADWGLPPDPTLDRLFPHLLLSFDPPSFVEPGVMPATTHHLCASPFDRSVAEATLPEWIARAERPLIYATLGTEAARMPGIFPDAYLTILESIREEPVTLIMTIGNNHDPALLGPQPPHIHIERYIPQSLLFPHVDLIITHGGHNTILAGLSAGLPMVVVPLFADQMDNAARCAALEAGRWVPAGEMTPNSLREAVRMVLDDQRYALNAKRLQKEMNTLPRLDHGRHLLERLAFERISFSAGA